MENWIVGSLLADWPLCFVRLAKRELLLGNPDRLDAVR
jgi:hypothetical protein